jgi:anti-sigma factor RsiW
MCPDRELLSAYADGEVPSPWRERIAEHLASCESCAALVAAYAALGESLRSDSSALEAAMVEVGRARLEALLESAKSRGAAPSYRPAGLRLAHAGSVWARSISLPLPLAAAAALALLLFAGLSASSLFRAPVQRGPALATAEVAPNGAQQVSMDGILRYLDSQNAQVTVTINLPSEATFNESGNPVIVRAPRAELAGTVQGDPVQGGNP